MRQLILTSAIALCLSMPFTATTSQSGPTGRGSYGLCPVGQVVEISRNGTGLWRSGRLICTVNEGTRVRIRGCSSSSPNSPVRVTLEGRGGNCGGIVNRNDVREIVATPTKQEVFTTGKWGDDVPVFRDRGSYFNARDRDKFENVVCRLKKGQEVEFKPYRDWGLGEVKTGDCQGWTDRGVIR